MPPGFLKIILEVLKGEQKEVILYTMRPIITTWCLTRSTDIFDYTYIDAFGKGKQLTVKECEYLIGHHVTEEFYGVVTSKEVLQRMVGNLLNLGKRWVVTEPCGLWGRGAHGGLAACPVLACHCAWVSALKWHQSHQAVLKTLGVTSQCLVAFNHLQQHCVEARIFIEAIFIQGNGQMFVFSCV